MNLAIRGAAPLARASAHVPLLRNKVVAITMLTGDRFGGSRQRLVHLPLELAAFPSTFTWNGCPLN